MAKLPTRSRLPRLVSTLLAAVVVAVCTHAAADESEEEEPEPGEISFIPVPGASYAKETSLLLGAALLMHLEAEEGAEKDSSALAAVAYSFRNQMAAVLRWSIYLGKDRWLLSGGVEATRFPGSYFGLGNDTRLGDEERYTPRKLNLELSPLARVVKDLYVGPALFILDTSIERRVDGGLLEQQAPPGTRGGLTLGGGVEAVYDTRDTSLNPYRGLLLSGQFRSHRGAWASDFDYERLELNLRGYLETWPRTILAAQLYSVTVHGNVPFYGMATLGGGELMRGMFEGRYRDRQALVAQVEYRLPPFLWRIGAVLFASAGQVVSSYEELALNGVRPAGGAGLRLLLDKAARANLRLDVGVSDDDWGIYVDLGEAF